jgi:hypothetical protein
MPCKKQKGENDKKGQEPPPHQVLPRKGIKMKYRCIEAEIKDKMDPQSFCFPHSNFYTFCEES